MKKKLVDRGNNLVLWSKFLIKMKLLAAFLIASFISVSASTYSQQTKISINANNLLVKDIFEKIEQQSEFIFLYSIETVDLKRKVNLNIKDGNIDEILTELFDKTQNCYKIKDRQIAILLKETKQVQQTENITEQKNEQIRVSGNVTDPEGVPLPGVTVMIVGSTKGVTTDPDGKYEITIAPTDKLKFSFIGMTSIVVDVKGKTKIDVSLKNQSEELGDVTVVAFGKQKKESVISAITTVDVNSLQAVPTSNITTALSGQMTGLISYQSTGAPGDDNAQFFIRNAASFGNNVQSPLILIDNIEVSSRQLSRLSPDDIQSFSILKDAAATALYGARGGNGVVLITTKEGKAGKAKIELRAESSLSMPTQKVDVANPIEYMQYFNEAILTRDPTASPRYSLEKIEKTQDPNRNPYVYPATDWLKKLTRDYAINKRVNLSIRGGGKVATYYVGGSFAQDNGILKVDNVNKWNTNINFKKFTLRSNVNINVNETTKLKVRLSGSFDDYKGPIGERGGNGRNTYYKALNADPVLFPAVYAPDKNFAYAPYLLFGNADKGQYTNPYERLMRGYEDNKASTLAAQIELKKDLSAITKGLSLRFIGNVSRYGNFSIERSYKPYYFDIDSYDQYADSKTPEHDGYTLHAINPEGGSRFIDYSDGYQKVTASMYGELLIDYSRTFNDKHDVGAMLVGTVRDYLEGKSGSSSLINSLPKRNLSMAGRLRYGYAGKYFAEFNFGYNGSERFAKGDRFGFFPSIGAGWDMAKENFFEDLGLNRLISKFKIRGTYGLTGNDNLGGPNRFYYLSSVNLNTNHHVGYWGNDLTVPLYSRPVVNITSPGNPDITWEITNKTNIALELGLLDDKLSITPEIYREFRKNILQRRSNIPSTLGLPYELYSNIQENLATGFECSMDYKDRFSNGFWYIVRGNFTYGTAEIKTIDEIGTKKAPWISRLGHSPSQNFGYVADHLFIDENEVANSADQSALGGSVMAGDIKYVDINKDGVINEYDRVAIGHPRTPEIQYGFGGSLGYKNFDFSIFFQGQGRYSFWINPHNVAPFISTGGGNRALLGWIAENHWSKNNRNLHAQWPRLSSNRHVGNSNNFQTSTYFMRTTTFLRLKQLEIGYTFKKVKLIDLRAYASGSNLLTFSKFKLWDPEMRGNGLAYPLQRVFNLGLQISFK